MANWRDTIVADIIEYMEGIDPSLETEDSSQVTATVEELLDRVLIYTGRHTLVEDYEEDLEYHTDTTDLFWRNYDRYPIPRVLVRSLARMGISMFKSITSIVNSALQVKSLEDNGQSITYGTELQNYFATSSDNEVFGGTIEILDKFRLADIVDNTQQF